MVREHFHFSIFISYLEIFQIQNTFALGCLLLLYIYIYIYIHIYIYIYYIYIYILYIYLLKVFCLQGILEHLQCDFIINNADFK